jgi:hypothetical protein
MGSSISPMPVAMDGTALIKKGTSAPSDNAS